MKWNYIKFGDLYAINSRNGLTKPSRVRGNGYKMINMGELFANDRIYDIPMELVPLNDTEKINAKVEVGDLLFARQSLALEGAGKCSIVLEVSPLTVFESHLIRVRLVNKANSMFYYYYFRSQLSPIKSIVSQCAQAGIRGSDLQELCIPFPSKESQDKIASILEKYDDLIENNQKQIKLLEEAAQRLYKEWFVDFRFPGYENAKFIDGIPEGWRKEPICNIVSYEIGGGWGEDYLKEQNDKPAFVIRGTDLHGITHGDILSIPYRYHTQSNLASRILQDGDIVFEVSGGSKTEGVARTLLIRKELLEIYGSPVMCASFCKLIRLVDNSLSQYMYNTLQYLRLSGKTSEFDKKSASSIVNYRWKDFLSQQDVLIPPLTIIEAYNRLAECYYYKIINQSKMIECLKNARDRLLPKLMSGEIEV